MASITIHFNIRYQCTEEDGSIKAWNSWNPVVFTGGVDYDEDINGKTKLIAEFSKFYEKDPNFKVLGVYASPTGLVDWDLMERMKCVREMCELGRKVRANTGIRNRQPLARGYVAFANQDVQSYMLFIDAGGKREYMDMLEDELNVINIDVIDETVSNQIFNFNIKPNFRSLGPKGYGKQAQGLKATLQGMSIEQKNEIHTQLKSGQVVEMSGVPLTLADVEVEFCPKENFTSSSGKVGAIVLDTTMNETLLELGFVAEFRSAAQALRREANLELTDKIFLEIFCSAKRANILEKHSSKLLKDLVSTGIRFFPPAEVDEKLAHRLFFHGEILKTERQIEEAEREAKLDRKELSSEPFYVALYKEENKEPKEPEKKTFKVPLTLSQVVEEELATAKLPSWREAIEETTKPFDPDGVEV
jgi:hypothetical protein